MSPTLEGRFLSSPAFWTLPAVSSVQILSGDPSVDACKSTSNRQGLAPAEQAAPRPDAGTASAHLLPLTKQGSRRGKNTTRRNVTLVETTRVRLKSPGGRSPRCSDLR